MQSSDKPRVAFYLPSLSGGGAEKVTLFLIQEFVRNEYPVDLILNKKKGPYLANVPDGVRIFELSRSSKLSARLLAWRAFPEDRGLLSRTVVFTRKSLMTLSKLPALVGYLASERPTVLVSALWYSNVLAIWARTLAQVDTRLAVTEHNTLSLTLADYLSTQTRDRRTKQMSELIRRLYSRADSIVAVSNGVAEDLAATTGLARGRVQMIYNPVITAAIVGLAESAIDNEWCENRAVRVILAIGRLNTQKNFSTLIDAFHRVRAEKSDLRLIILGEGPLRSELESQIARLGLTDDVLLPGWVDNPYSYMSRARMLVLSSLWEGLPTVLIEALACGCPVVATDCPSGPREILAEGRYGSLIEPGDVDALADAINQTVESSIDKTVLKQRAGDFSITAGFDAYQDLVDKLAAQSGTEDKPHTGSRRELV